MADAIEHQVVIVGAQHACIVFVFQVGHLPLQLPDIQFHLIEQLYKLAETLECRVEAVFANHCFDAEVGRLLLEHGEVGGDVEYDEGLRG